MITLFTAPKPFTGRNTRPQDNAIASWRAAVPEAQIILFGDEEGIEDAARRHGIEHAPVVKNEFGTPLLDHIFADARRLARFPLLGYVNADILFTGSLRRAIDTIARLPWPDFLVVGRRIDLDFGEALDVAAADWERVIGDRARMRGRLHEPTGIDYMLLPAAWPLALPSFPVGRVLWDNWMIHEARRTGVAVIEATSQILAIHQNHDYAHIGGKRAASAAAEVARNWALVGPDFLPLTISDATHELTARGARPLRDLAHMLRRFLVAPALTPGLRVSIRVARKAWQLLRSGVAPKSGR